MRRETVSLRRGRDPAVPCLLHPCIGPACGQVAPTDSNCICRADRAPLAPSKERLAMRLGCAVLPMRVGFFEDLRPACCHCGRLEWQAHGLDPRGG